MWDRRSSSHIAMNTRIVLKMTVYTTATNKLKTKVKGTYARTNTNTHTYTHIYIYIYIYIYQALLW